METWNWEYVGNGAYVCGDYHVYHDGQYWQCESSDGMIGGNYSQFLWAISAASRTAGQGNADGYHVVDGGWPE